MFENKKNFFKKNMELILLFLLLITFDQTVKIFTSKIMISNNFTDLNIFPFLNLVFVRNTGISFGLFSDGGVFNRYFFSVFSVLVGTVIFFISLLSENKLVKAALILISAGAFGNAIDRIYFGGVIDFIDIFLYTYHWPAFNFADIFITIGVIILLFENLFYDKKNIN